MSDWLHCNTCFAQPGDGRFYYLTSCGHIFCERCESKGWKEKCLMCGTSAPSSMKLDSKLPPQVEPMLANPISTAEKISSLSQQLVSSMDFQNSQRRRFFSNLQKMVANQQNNVKKLQQDLMTKFRAQAEAMNRELARLKKENTYLKCIIQEQSSRNTLRSPNPDWRSPGQKALVSSSSQMDRNHNAVEDSRRASGPPSSSVSSRPGPSYGSSHITSGRISVRTPPSGGKMGVIPKQTPSPSPYFQCNPTPKSVPHPMNFGDKMDI